MLSGICSRCGEAVNAKELESYMGKKYCKRCWKESAYNASNTDVGNRIRIPKRRQDDVERD